MRKAAAFAALPIVLTALACAPAQEEETVTKVDSCAVADLELFSQGKLTVATDKPAFEPWFQDNDPTNQKGFEAAVAYAVADEMGFKKDQVEWVKVPFNQSFAPGDKKFDFDINQISVTDERQQVVDFSEGYYTASQAVITMEDDAGKAASLDDLKGLKLGAQTGTTSLTVVRDSIKPDEQPLVFQSTSAAKQALLNGQVDAIVADLPTAFYITAVEIEGSTITGQFDPAGADPEEFGLLLAKGNKLLPCVNKAVEALKEDGTLDDLEQKWLSDVVDVPVLK